MAMRFERILGVAAIVLAASWPCGAGAQGDSGAAAAGDGVIHLHMPGAETAPGAAAGGATIHLHPIHERPDATNAQPGAAAPAAETKSSGAGGTSGKAVIPFNFGEEDAAAPADGGPYPGAPEPSLKTASIPPHASSSDDEHAGLSKHGAVLFEKGATDPSPAQFQGV